MSTDEVIDRDKSTEESDLLQQNVRDIVVADHCAAYQDEDMRVKSRILDGQGCPLWTYFRDVTNNGIFT